MENLSNFFIPLIVLVIIIYGIRKKVNVYDAFISGAKEGIELAFSIFPCLITMMFAINILLSSNFITDIFSILKPVLDILKIPVEIIPMMITRPISGNASYAVMIDIVKNFGVDSYLGKLACILQGSTDTTIYVLSIYFSSIGIKNIRYALKAGLFADFIAFVFSILILILIMWLKLNNSLCYNEVGGKYGSKK